MQIRMWTHYNHTADRKRRGREGESGEGWGVCVALGLGGFEAKYAGKRQSHKFNTWKASYFSLVFISVLQLETLETLAVITCTKHTLEQPLQKHDPYLNDDITEFGGLVVHLKSIDNK